MGLYKYSAPINLYEMHENLGNDQFVYQMYGTMAEINM